MEIEYTEPENSGLVTDLSCVIRILNDLLPFHFGHLTTHPTEYSKLRTLDNELKNISKGHLVYPSQHNTFPTHQKIRALAYPLLSTGI